MKKAVLSLVLTISVTFSPLQAHAVIEDSSIFTPLLFALLLVAATSQQSPSMTRSLKEIPLLEHLEEGAYAITTERAVEVLKNKGQPLSPADRTIVTNSVMAHVMSNRFWMDRTRAFSTLYLDIPWSSRRGYVSSSDFRDKLNLAFRNRNIEISGFQENMIGQFADVLAFELAVRDLGIPAHPVRNSYLAAYLMAISASLGKLDYAQRLSVMEGVLNGVASVNQAIVSDISQLVDEGGGVLTPKQASINFFSDQYMPPWFLGGAAGFLTFIGSMITLTINDSGMIRTLETLGVKNPSNGEIAIAGLIAVPTIVGTASAFAYRSIISQIFRSKANEAASQVLQSACKLMLKAQSPNAG